MKKAIFVLALLAGLGVSRAEAGAGLATTTVFKSTMSITGTTAPTASPTDLMANTPPFQYTFVAVQNLDATDNVYCSTFENVTVTTGFKIFPGALFGTSLVAGQSFYCINDGAGPVNIVLLRGL